MVNLSFADRMMVDVVAGNSHPIAVVELRVVDHRYIGGPQWPTHFEKVNR